VTAAVELTNREWLAERVSRTFHGRDVFAPVAARLALGAPLERGGPAVDPATLVRLPEPVVEVTPDGFTAEVLTVDHFGNVQLAAVPSLLDGLPSSVTVAGRDAVHGRTFADAAPGELVLYADSAGLVAVAVNGGRAATLLGVAAGDRLRVRRPD
jgi:S-adenosylmethionine hydrolase